MPRLRLRRGQGGLMKDHKSSKSPAARAERLRNQIERLRRTETGEAGETPSGDEARPQSPRDFTNEAASEAAAVAGTPPEGGSADFQEPCHDEPEPES